MEKDLLSMDRLPTMDEMKEFFRKHDWTTAQISDPATRTEEERAEIAYVAAIMDKKFEELAQQKGRPSSAKYYGENNPLIVLQRNTEDLVSSAVVKIANDDALLDGALSAFDFNDPDIDEKADRMFHSAIDTMLEVMEYDKLAAIVHESSCDEDFNKNIENNFRYKDHVRRWDHTDAKVKVALAPNPGANMRSPSPSVENQAISNVMLERFTLSLDPVDRKIFNRIQLGYTQDEVAKELGFKDNGPVSKRYAKIKKKYLEWVK